MGDSDDTKSTSGLVGRIRNDYVYRVRFLNTVFVVWMFISLGWNNAVFGSVFPDLRLIIHKDLDTASWIFTDGAIGFSLGALIFGYLLDRFDRIPLLVVTIVLCSVTFAIVPWCENFAVLLVIYFFNGIFTGGIDVGGNTHVAALWGRHTAPYMQAIHFGFSFGGIISPLTAEPFVAEKQCLNNLDRRNSSTDGGSINYTNEATTSASLVTTECVEAYGQTHAQYAYLIGAIVSLTSAVPFLLTHFLLRAEKSQIDEKDGGQNDDKEQSRDTLPEISTNQKVLFVTLLMLLIGIYASAEGRFSGLLSSFVVDYQNWTKADSLHLSSLFWGAFAAGRFLSIGVSKLLTPSTMIVTYVLSLSASFIGFLIAAHYKANVLIWVFTAASGLCMSSIYPCIFTWTAESILRVTGKITAVYSVGAAVFNSLAPILYGYLMDNSDPMYFAYLLLSQGVICFLIYLAIRVLIRIFIHDNMRVN